MKDPGVLKTVRQSDEKGCGVACVAMLTGVSYAEAREVIYPSGRLRLTRTKDLAVALKVLGRKPLSERRRGFGLTTVNELETDALVFVELIQDSGNFKHWMVWDAQAKKLRDPDGRKLPYRLRGYLAVEGMTALPGPISLNPSDAGS